MGGRCRGRGDTGAAPGSTGAAAGQGHYDHRFDQFALEFAERWLPRDRAAFLLLRIAHAAQTIVKSPLTFARCAQISCIGGPSTISHERHQRPPPKPIANYILRCHDKP